MFATVLSLFVAFFLFSGGACVPELLGSIVFPKDLFQGIFGVLLFFSLTPWLSMFLFSRRDLLCPVVQSSVNSCFSDRGVKFFSAVIFLLSLLGIIMFSQTFLPVLFLYGLAVLGAGISIDCLRLSFLRMQACSTPEGIADWLLKKLKKAVHHGDEKGVIASFELIFSLLVRYAKRGDISSMRCFSMKVPGMIEELLRSVSKLPIFMITGDDTLLDRHGVAEAITAKRLAWAMKETGENGNPAALEETMRLYGKLFMVFHNSHDSLGNLLFVSLSQNLLKITQPGELEKDAEYMMVCSEVIKSLIDRANDRRVSEKIAVMRVLNVLETHVKECFRKDRTISPAFLMQPFAEVGQLLGSDRYAALPDREDILSELRRILTQFSALETVSMRIEGAEPGTDTKATYHEDLPFQKPVTT